MVSIEIEAKKISFCESYPEDLSTPIKGKGIGIQGKLIFESLSPECSFILREGVKELPIPKIGTVFIQSSDDNEPKSPFWGEACYISKYEEDEFPRRTFPATIKVNIYCSQSTFDDVWKRLQGDSIKVNFLGSFFPNTTDFYDVWDISKKDPETEFSSRTLTSINLTTYKILEEKTNLEAYNWLSEERHKIEESRKVEDQRSFAATRVEAIGIFVLGVVLFGFLQLIGLTTLTSFFVAISAIIAYCFGSILYQLISIRINIHWLQDDINANHHSKKDINWESQEDDH